MNGVFLAGLCAAIAVFDGRPAAQAAPKTMEQMHKLHGDPKAYIAMLDDPERDAYQKPHEVLAALALREGERIADIGAGSGYFALRFATHVGKTGRVYAIDVSPDMILHLNRRIRSAGVDNMRTILAPPDDPLLPDASVNRVFLSETWHHIEGRAAYLGVLKKALKPGGEVIILDFQKGDTPVGPPVEMRVSREDVISELQASGFRLVKEHTFLPYQYLLVFRRE